MEGLTLSAKEQNRLQILNGVLEQRWSMREAALLLGVSERQGWRLLAAYRKEGARGLAHKNRGRMPPTAGHHSTGLEDNVCPKRGCCFNLTGATTSGWRTGGLG